MPEIDRVRPSRPIRPAVEQLEVETKPSLNSKTPLLLLPIRIETVFSSDVTELRVRVYPDQINIDSDEAQLTVAEIAAAESFWSQFDETKDPALRDSLWAEFSQQVGHLRAGHIARTVRDHKQSGKELTPRDGDPAATAVLLPDRWVVLCFRGDDLVKQQGGRNIVGPLETSPTPGVQPVEVTEAGLQVSPGMEWMYDYGRAVEVGMAVTVDLTDVPKPKQGFTTVLVLGVRKADGEYEKKPEAFAADEAKRFARLLEMHERSAGLAFVEPGTNTNNLADRPSPWKRRLRSPSSVLDEPSDWKQLDGTSAAELAHALGLPEIGALERADGARARGREHARHMNQVLAEPLLLHFVRHMLGNKTEVGLPTNALLGLRRWFINQVTGGDPLPTIRVGPQPYGVLPIGSWPATSKDPVAAEVVRFVDELEPMWARSVENVPRIDPNATDTVTLGSDDVDAEAVDLIPAVIAQHPHAARLFTRTFYPLDEDFWSGLSTQSVYGFLRHVWIGTDCPELEDYADQVDALANTVEAQIVLWELGVASIEAGLFQYRGDDLAADRRDDVLAVATSILNLLNGWEYKQRPLQDLNLPRWNGALGHPAPPRLVDGRFGDEREWEPDQLIGPDPAAPVDPDQPAAPSPADYLTTVADRLSGAGKELDFGGRDPILHQMLERAESTLAPGRVTDVVRSLRRLAAIADQTGGHARLDRLVRETLGLVTSRLDAWMTSVHSHRLEGLRGDLGRAPEGGLHLGNYGVVTDLVPSKLKASSGYVLAPSLAHAATAAVLRSAWLSHGSSAPTSAAAVDLTSRRIRTAEWVLDGIRNGQQLGELLGYRFERHLHDAGASGAIHGVRQQVIELRRTLLRDGSRRHGRADTSANEPVDGLELLDVRDDLDYGGTLADLEADVVAALDAIAEVADAVADVALFDGTHQLMQGNTARAAAMFDAVSLGQGTPPELRSHLVRPDGMSVDHRVVVLVPADARPAKAWPEGVRDLVSPQVAAWIERMVPPADRVVFTVAGRSQPASITTFTADELGISAYDLVALSAGDPNDLAPALASLLIHRLGLPVDVELIASPDTIGGDAIGFDEFQTLARELISVMERATPATTSTLTPPDGQPDEPPEPAVDSNVAEQLLARFAEAVKSEDPERMADLAVFGWPLGPDPLARHPEFVKNARRINRAFAKFKDPTRLIEELFVQTPLILPSAQFGTVIDPDGSQRSYQFVDDESFASDTDVDAWLAAMGRVREEVGRATAASMLSTMLGVMPLQVAVAQDVIEPGERWAALHRPTGDVGGRASLVALVADDDSPGTGDRYVGFVVDSWSERIPKREQVGGVAFHHDAPSNRPPQSMLLAVPDGETPWTLAGVADMILDTVDWAKKRVVAPEDFEEWGHALPMSVVPGRLIGWPKEVPEP